MIVDSGQVSNQGEHSTMFDKLAEKMHMQLIDFMVECRRRSRGGKTVGIQRAADGTPVRRIIYR